jgi:hypothetical protein
MSANRLSFHLADAPKLIAKKNIASVSGTTENAPRSVFALTVITNRQPSA